MIILFLDLKVIEPILDFEGTYGNSQNLYNCAN
jgi:hypothetical protein